MREVIDLGERLIPLLCRLVCQILENVEIILGCLALDLHLGEEVSHVLGQVDDDDSYVILALLIGSTLVDQFLADLSGTQLVIPHDMHLLRHLLFSEDPKEPVSGENEEVVISLDLVGASLRLRNQILLVLNIPDGSADSDIAIDSGYVILGADKAIIP